MKSLILLALAVGCGPVEPGPEDPKPVDGAICGDWCDNMVTCHRELWDDLSDADAPGVCLRDCRELMADTASGVQRTATCIAKASDCQTVEACEQ